MTIGITGATGQLGRLVVSLLKGRTPATGLVALVRSPAKAAELGIAARAWRRRPAGGMVPGRRGVIAPARSGGDRPAGQPGCGAG